MRDEAIRKARAEADEAIAAARGLADQRVVRAELKAVAVRNGIVDLDGLRLLDLSGIRMDECRRSGGAQANDRGSQAAQAMAVRRRPPAAVSRGRRPSRHRPPSWPSI